MTKAKYIDIGPIIEAIKSSLEIKSYSDHDRGFDDGLDYVMGLIDDQPTLTLPNVNAVPVVRCKDCKYAFERSGRKPFGCYLHGKNGITLHDGDDFCSYGERKTIESE